MEESLNFHGYFRLGMSPEEVYKAVDAAANKMGLELISAPRDEGADWHYAKPDFPSLNVAFDFQEKWGQLLLSRVYPSDFEKYGTLVIRNFIAAVSEAVELQLGRSYMSGGLTIVSERERGGKLECLNWIQFLGPEVVTRWGIDYLKNGPFHDVELREKGGCVILMGESPFERLKNIRAAADYLGITLRPVYSKDSKGRRVRINW